MKYKQAARRTAQNPLISNTTKRTLYNDKKYYIVEQDIALKGDNY